ncbi:alpha/beta fold hydrolase [Georgenia subflava]|uniref:Alpha/beta fold hydrolase n=1 Tax=Georgenia subflava TaxID=1622177 RepID=A0A6N7EMP1_9MICO|nr:alpha/beta hydrolase [Georgenia subflava]MPV38137.1 alpha/beta fold hydrolase [Georgenia subflava]
MTPVLSLTRHGEPGGLPLVLLHAFPLDSRMWDEVVALLPELDVITLDAPGFGGSPTPLAVAERLGRPTEPALETYAAAVVDSLRSTGVERAVVAGLSMGGYAALALAERHRSLLAGIGLLDTKASADDDAARANRLRVAEAAAGDAGSEAVAPMVDQVLGETTHAQRPELVERMRALLGEAPPVGIAWAQRAMAVRPDRTAALEDLDVPALVLRGAEDGMSPQSALNAMAEALSDVEVVVVPRSGHMSALEAPDQVADALRALHARCR